MSFDTYAPFPFLPPIVPGKYGSVYEIRTLSPQAWGRSSTIAAWEAAARARQASSPLSIAMYALDGPPRFTHIWPFASLGARAAMRARIRRQGRLAAEGRPRLAGRRHAFDRRAADGNLPLA